MADPTHQSQEPSQNSGITPAESLSGQGGTRYISYSQTTGELNYHDGERDFAIGIGWAGNGLGKNNPSFQTVKSIGPLPRGWYRIGQPQTHPTVGPFALRLTPIGDTEMFGRDGFLIHGAARDISHYGKESKGCIVTCRSTREKIHSLGVDRLQVVV